MLPLALHLSLRLVQQPWIQSLGVVVAVVLSALLVFWADTSYLGSVSFLCGCLHLVGAIDIHSLFSGLHWIISDRTLIVVFDVFYRRLPSSSSDKYLTTPNICVIRAMSSTACVSSQLFVDVVETVWSTGLGEHLNNLRLVPAVHGLQCRTGGSFIFIHKLFQYKFCISFPSWYIRALSWISFSRVFSFPAA